MINLSAPLHILAPKFALEIRAGRRRLVFLHIIIGLQGSSRAFVASMVGLKVARKPVDLRRVHEGEG